MSFKQYVSLFADLQTPLGTLCSDILSDKDFDFRWSEERMMQHILFAIGNDERSKLVIALFDFFNKAF